VRTALYTHDDALTDVVRRASGGGVLVDISGTTGVTDNVAVDVNKLKEYVPLLT
jgi:hypothetical protein